MQDHVKKDSIKRLKSAKGHLEHVIGLVDSGRYCVDIIQQSLAVQAALREVDNLILKGHLEEHASKAMHGKNKEESIKEIVDLFSKARK